MTSARVRVGYLADAIGGGGGIGRYTRELLGLLGRRDDVELVVVAPPDDVRGVEQLALPSVVEVLAAGGRGQVARALWERYRLGRVLDRHDVDVVHGTKHLLPRTALPTVLTVYDVMPLSSPEQFSLAKRILLPRQYRRSLRQATVLVAISETTRARLVAIDPTLAASTRVVPLGFTAELRDVDPVPLPGWAADDSFALVVGDLAPRKNLGLLLDLWPDVHRTTGLGLVVVGPEGWRSAATRKRLEQLEQTGVARWCGRVPDGQLRWAYEHAAMLLFPSREEGYGLPVVEALELGVPIIASNDAALVEIAEGHALHLDPDEREVWRAAILAAVEAGERPRPALGRRLTWTQTADATVAAYRDAIAEMVRA
jgi:glycosyltransferase involved in cell wall biosynthesis